MLEQGSQSEFAKQYGYSKAAVTQFKQAGRLVFKSPGILDFAASKQKIYDTSDIARKASTDRHEKVRKEKGIQQQDKTENYDTGNAFHNAKTVREKYLALQVKLDYETNLGRMVEKSQVEKIIFERARQFRDGLITCKHRISPELAGIESSKDIENILDREFRILLAGFAKLPVVE